MHVAMSEILSEDNGYNHIRKLFNSALECKIFVPSLRLRVGSILGQ